MTLSKNQRMVCGRKNGSVRLWAVAISVAVHLAGLAVFGFVKFSKAEDMIDRQPTPTAHINRVKKLINTTAAIPKPKIKRPDESRKSQRPLKILSKKQIFDTAISESKPSAETRKPSTKTEFIAAGRIMPGEIEFFGSRTAQRKICFLVDRSGSMKGIFGHVRRNLKKSISSLQQDNYFCIVFFGGNNLVEFTDGSMVRATKSSKAKAFAFVDSIQPAGKTNAIAALEKAMKIRDRSGNSAGVVYFLTDGFDLTGANTDMFLTKVRELSKEFAPAIKINTIGFWPQSRDRQILEAMARQSGGEFIAVTNYNN